MDMEESIINHCQFLGSTQIFKLFVVLCIVEAYHNICKRCTYFINLSLGLQNLLCDG